MQTLNSSRNQSWLVWFFKGLLVLALLIFTSRLLELQIIKGAYYRSLSDDNRVRRVAITAPRGIIFARNGEKLVQNKKELFTVDFTPKTGFQKIFVYDSTPQEEILVDWEREYLLGERLGHVSGYVSEVNEEEVGSFNPDCPEKGVRLMGSITGRSGLEKYYDCKLRGITGEELVEVDSFGNKIRVIGRKDPSPGQDLHTTLDYELQKVISSRLNDKKGAIVVSTPNGEVLAIYSSPSYNPNHFVQNTPSSKEALSQYLKDENLPLFNRAIGGNFHPGSIFKLVTAIGALEEKSIDREFEYEDTGVIKVDEYEFKNWYYTQYGGAEGLIGLQKALARSTDTFFYKVGEEIGPDKLAEWAQKFNLSKTTGIDLPGEVQGLVPTPQWKKAIKGERWYLGNTYHMAIGQGDLSVSVIQANMIAQTIANQGKLCTPHIVQKDSNCLDLKINLENLETVIAGMESVCSEGGTAFPFFDFNPKVACKTGTAETFKEDITHAWFTVFAPSHNPEIVLTILIEEGGEGSAEAAPIAREILDYWFHNRT